VDALVLIVEDEPDIAEALTSYLRHAGLRTEHVANGLAALEQFFALKPQLVLLDLMLPGLNGLEVLRIIRDEHQTPVIVLTARADEPDILRGFERGADDYIPKPFRPREVVARVLAVLRRSSPEPELVLQGLAGLEINLQTREVKQDNLSIDLTAAEFELITTLLRAPGKVFTRLELLEAIGGLESETLERTVDAHIKNLRKKLGEQHGLQTVYGVGYRYGS
jgi:DNA-binding response OmpR family regulator